MTNKNPGPKAPRAVSVTFHNEENVCVSERWRM